MEREAEAGNRASSSAGQRQAQLRGGRSGAGRGRATRAARAMRATSPRPAGGRRPRGGAFRRTPHTPGRRRRRLGARTTSPRSPSSWYSNCSPALRAGLRPRDPVRHRREGLALSRPHPRHLNRDPPDRDHARSKRGGGGEYARIAELMTSGRGHQPREPTEQRHGVQHHRALTRPCRAPEAQLHRLGTATWKA
jgi:hypothetical protein